MSLFLSVVPKTSALEGVATVDIVNLFRRQTGLGGRAALALLEEASAFVALPFSTGVAGAAVLLRMGQGDTGRVNCGIAAMG